MPHKDEDGATLRVPKSRSHALQTFLRDVNTGRSKAHHNESNYRNKSVHEHLPFVLIENDLLQVTQVYNKLPNAEMVDPNQLDPRMGIDNRVPFIAYEQRTRRHREGLDHQIVDPEYEIVSTLAQLTYMRDQLMITRCNFALSPRNRKLPTEILQVIFQEATKLPARFPPYRLEAPLQLCHVCVRWREVAMATQNLWNSIVYYDPQVRGQARNIAELVAWFSRAGPLPLSMHTRGLSFTQTYDPDWYLRFVLGRVLPVRLVKDVVRPFSTQLRELRLVLSRRQTMHFLHLPGGLFPSLEVIEICSESANYCDPPQVDVFQDLPQLHSVTLDLRRYARLNDLRLPWSQLVALRILHEVYPTPAFRLLRRMPRLRDILFQSHYIDEPHDWDQDLLHPLILPALKRCKMEGLRNSSPAFEALTTPNLQQLFLGISLRHVTPTIYNFFALATSLKRLSLDLDTLHNEYHLKLATILQGTPNLTKLTITGPGIYVQREILKKIGTGALVPGIQELYLSTNKLDAAFTMIMERNLPPSSRIAGPCSSGCLPFKTVWIDYPNSEPPHSDRITSLRNEGLNIISIPNGGLNRAGRLVFDIGQVTPGGEDGDENEGEGESEGEDDVNSLDEWLRSEEPISD